MKKTFFLTALATSALGPVMASDQFLKQASQETPQIVQIGQPASSSEAPLNEGKEEVLFSFSTKAKPVEYYNKLCMPTMTDIYPLNGKGMEKLVSAVKKGDVKALDEFIKRHETQVITQSYLPLVYQLRFPNLFPFLHPISESSDSVLHPTLQKKLITIPGYAVFLIHALGRELGEALPSIKRVLEKASDKGNLVALYNLTCFNAQGNGYSTNNPFKPLIEKGFLLAHSKAIPHFHEHPQILEQAIEKYRSLNSTVLETLFPNALWMLGNLCCKNLSLATVNILYKKPTLESFKYHLAYLKKVGAFQQDPSNYTDFLGFEEYFKKGTDLAVPHKEPQDMSSLTNVIDYLEALTGFYDMFKKKPPFGPEADLFIPEICEKFLPVIEKTNSALTLLQKLKANPWGLMVSGILPNPEYEKYFVPGNPLIRVQDNPTHGTFITLGEEANAVLKEYETVLANWDQMTTDLMNLQALYQKAHDTLGTLTMPFTLEALTQAFQTEKDLATKIAQRELLLAFHRYSNDKASDKQETLSLDQLKKLTILHLETEYLDRFAYDLEQLQALKSLLDSFPEDTLTARNHRLRQ
jgi:hypothetical protein